MVLAITLAALFLIPLIPVDAQTSYSTQSRFEFPNGSSDFKPNYLPVEPPEPLYVDTQKMYISEDVIDPYLLGILEETADSGLLEIIVQFIGKIKPVDIVKLKLLGFEIKQQYSVIPGIHCIGTRAAVEALAEYDRVFWIEYNEELEYYMHGTTTVINATKVWNSDIISFSGRNQGRIDGSGITVVVLDSGIDAGHPDMDYGTKTIMNLKSDNGAPPWIEMENSDTSSGHGTHCAGTVAGNGDASGGARRGVAPGANLIGLSVGELVVITGAVGGLDWVYDNSKPGSNRYNIRVVSNSWGAGGGEYHPEDSISQASERITYENNVVVVFAAGNSGGDGSDIQSSNYGNAPANICVAALEHDGEGVASFSSRGNKDLNGTFPDIGAPGVRIWSTAARRTMISASTKMSANTDFNPYYFPISGTSMATPHISGISALIWQAYPGLKTSNTHDDYDGDDFPDWFNVSNTLVHEVELILEASAKYLEPNADNGVPGEPRIGWTGNRHDFAQGYGMAMVDRAVAIALTLKELRTRDFDFDGFPDYPYATVMDAMNQYDNIITHHNVTTETDKLEYSWRGEWVKFNNQSTNALPYYTDESHMLYIPADAKSLTLTLSFSVLQTSKPQVGTLRLLIDGNGDGNPDWSQPLNLEENKVSEIDLGSSGLSGFRGGVWVFNVEGYGYVLQFTNFFKENQFYEARIPYTVSAIMTMDHAANPDAFIDFRNFHAQYGQWEFADPSYEYQNGTITMERHFFELANVNPICTPPEPKEEEETNYWPWILLAMALIAGLVLFTFYRKRKGQKEQRKTDMKAQEPDRVNERIPEPEPKNTEVQPLEPEEIVDEPIE
jgi:serine protease AprX